MQNVCYFDYYSADTRPEGPPCPSTPRQDDFNKIPELQACIAEALYDVDSIVADPGAYGEEQLTMISGQETARFAIENHRSI